MSNCSTRGFACLTWIVVVILLAPATTAIARSAAAGCEPVPVMSTVTGVFVEPDDGYRPVIDELDAAVCSIDLNIYLLSDPVILDALMAAHGRGVDVRILIEEFPFGGSSDSTVSTLAYLDDAGIDWQYTPDRFRFSHAKYVVVDRVVGIVMNLNLTPSAFHDNREFGAITTDAAIVQPLQAVFDADWSDTSATFAETDIVVSPDNARSKLLAAIGQAHVSIDMYAEVVRDDAIVSALVGAERSGVRVRLIVNVAMDDLDFSVYSRLVGAGVEISGSSHLYVHAKAMIIDGGRVLIGSHNPTSTSIDENREVSLIVSDGDGVLRVIRTFSYDWARSAPVFG